MAIRVINGDQVCEAEGFELVEGEHHTRHQKYINGKVSEVDCLTGPTRFALRIAFEHREFALAKSLRAETDEGSYNLLVEGFTSSPDGLVIFGDAQNA